MSIFGRTAINAAYALQDDPKLTPETAWQNAMDIEKQRGYKANTIYKPCPRLAFISLCYMGCINGVVRENPNFDSVEQEYMITLLDLIRQNRQYLDLSNDDLWKLVCDATHQSQIPIVRSLLHENLLLL